MNKKQILKLSGDLLHIAFVIPAIFFWSLYSYSGYSLEGFLSFSAFILHGYQIADEPARHIFARGLIYGYFGFMFILGVVMIILSFGYEEERNG